MTTTILFLVTSLLLLLIIFLSIAFSMKKDVLISRNIFIKASVDKVWNTVTNLIRQIEWRQDLQKVEIKDDDQSEVWVEIFQNGDQISKRVVKSSKYKIFEVEILPKGGYSGNIKIEFTPSQAGTTLRITEYIIITNPLRRPFTNLKKLEKRLDAYQNNLKQLLDHSA